MPRKIVFRNNAFSISKFTNWWKNLAGENKHWWPTHTHTHPPICTNTQKVISLVHDQAGLIAVCKNIYTDMQLVSCLHTPCTICKQSSTLQILMLYTAGFCCVSNVLCHLFGVGRQGFACSFAASITQADSAQFQSRKLYG